MSNHGESRRGSDGARLLHTSETYTDEDNAWNFGSARTKTLTTGLQRQWQRQPRGSAATAAASSASSSSSLTIIIIVVSIIMVIVFIFVIAIISIVSIVDGGRLRGRSHRARWQGRQDPRQRTRAAGSSLRMCFDGWCWMMLGDDD